ncbi:predicted protein [Chaetoceros tenuissimus]|uniref:Uncharacterized protein n=1 Tax=Chaetoceros tenuissimus TaxID=426638 RepID=A0AAD3GYT7_9STRA|nr:predicted protein [Chaetoceros tenuissimus]
MGLFVKKDIVEKGLLHISLCHQEHDIFDYLVNWDPDALINSRHDSLPLIHAAYFQNRRINYLKAGFKHHPNICGLLFIKDADGTTALEHLYNSMGEDGLINTLFNILSSMKDYPILHHIFTKAPKHKELFAKRFPWAGNLKDHNGRSLQQAILAAGPNVMNENEVLFAMLTDDQIQEKDPITTLFPFAAMAVGEHADLYRCFYLLRRHPSVMDKRSRVNLTVRHQSRKKRKVSK